MEVLGNIMAVVQQPKEDPFERFAGIERLVSKIYFRFSHLFLHRGELRDFWWQMARDEEQPAFWESVSHLFIARSTNWVSLNSVINVTCLGFELGSGTANNTTLPEETAGFMRRAR